MIEAKGLTKRYGATVAVDDLSFEVETRQGDRLPRPERGRQVDHHADDPRSGHPDRAATVTIDGQRYRDLHQPLTKVGALLDAKWVHPNRSARAHLALDGRVQQAAEGLASTRCWRWSA